MIRIITAIIHSHVNLKVPKSQKNTIFQHVLECPMTVTRDGYRSQRHFAWGLRFRIRSREPNGVE